MASQPKVKVYSQDNTSTVRQDEGTERVTDNSVVDTKATYSTTPVKRRAPNWIMIVLLIIAAIILFNLIF